MVYHFVPMVFFSSDRVLDLIVSQWW